MKVRTKQLFIVWLLLDIVSSLEHADIPPFLPPFKKESNGSMFRIHNRLSNSQNDPSETGNTLYSTDNLLSYDDFINYSPQKHQNSSFHETRPNSHLDENRFLSSDKTSKSIKIQNLKETDKDFSFNNSVQSDDISAPFEPPLPPADAPNDLFTLPLQAADLLPVIDNVNSDPFNKFLTAPVVPYNMEGSEIIEPEFIVPDDLAFAPPVPPPFVQPVKTYALTINDGTVKRNEVRKDNGEYISSYTSADGTMRSESARLIRTSTGEEVLVYKGSYSFSTPDGQKFRVDYTADRDGFRSTTNPVTDKPTQVSTSTQRPVSQGSSQQQSQKPYQKPPQIPYQQRPQNPYQQPPQNPSQRPPQKPYQPPTQNPYQQPPQKPYQRPPQKPYPLPPQKPYQQPPQKPYQQPAQNPYQQPPQKPYQQPPQKPYQQPPQKPYQLPPQRPYQQPPQNPYQQPTQNPHQQPIQNPYQQPPQKPNQQQPQRPYQQIPQKPYQQPIQSQYQQSSQNPYQTPQTHPIAVQLTHLPFNKPKRPKKPPPSPLHKPTQIPIIVLPNPILQGHSRLPLVQPNQQSNKPPVFIKLPQKPIPHLTNELLVHPIPSIPNMHRPTKG